jgi:hypothetical protein
VTHLLGFPIDGALEAADDSRQGLLTVIDPQSAQVVDQILLPPNRFGIASFMASVAIHEGRVWIPHLRAAPALPNSLTTVVFAAVSTINLDERQEQPNAFLALNDQEIFGSPVNNPAAIAPSPDGKTLYLVHGGSDLVEIVDVADPLRPKLVKFLPAGKNPRGIALSPDGQQAYVMNYLSRSVSIYDTAQMAFVEEVQVTAEPLAANILAGKILFHNATDPRLSRGGWVSCASCHFDGWPDGITWIFPDGPRQTPMLWNAAATLPWHWSAALDEPQDVDETVLLIQHGLGLYAGEIPPLLGEPLQGQSETLDALAAFMMAGMRAPSVMPVESGENRQTGRALFVSKGCATCHGGPNWTTSHLPGAPGTLDSDGNGVVDEVLHNVGTATARDIRGESGFDVPSLLGVGLTPPYFHDGSIGDLELLLGSGHPQPSTDNPLTEREIRLLADLLRSIDATTPTFDLP